MTMNLVSLAIAISNVAAIVFLLRVVPSPRPAFVWVLVTLGALSFVGNLLFGIGVL